MKDVIWQKENICSALCLPAGLDDHWELTLHHTRLAVLIVYSVNWVAQPTKRLQEKNMFHWKRLLRRLMSG